MQQSSEDQDVDEAEGGFEAPNLPNAPPPEALIHSEESRKDKLSPHTSPKQKRVDHLKDESKKKRTPSFNLRRKTRSFKEKYKLPDNLPPAEIEGFLDRKQEFQSGGKKAAIRSWKNFYTVLYGQIMAFFRDKESKCHNILIIVFKKQNYVLTLVLKKQKHVLTLVLKRITCSTLY